MRDAKLISCDISCDVDLTTQLILQGKPLSYLQTFPHTNLSVETSRAAAQVGDVQLMEWLLKKSCPFDKSVCVTASKCGNVAALKWLHANGCPWDEETVFLTHANRHTYMVSWAVRNGCINEQILQFLKDKYSMSSIRKWKRQCIDSQKSMLQN